MSDTQDLQEATRAYFELARSCADKIEADSAVDRADGFRFLLRMVSYAINIRANYDVDHPRFFKGVTPIHKMYLDSPDTDYHRCNINLQDNRVYRITGFVPADVLYYSFQMYGGNGRVGANIYDEELSVGSDRTFVLYLMAKGNPFDAKGAKVLHGEGDEIAVIGRQYFTDRLKDSRVRFDIRLVSKDTTPSVSHELRMAHLTRLAGKLLEGLLDNTIHAYQMMRMVSINTLVVAGTNSRLFPTTDNRYIWARILLVPGKTVLVRGVRPNCRYFSISLVNMWLETLDYFQNQIFLNHTQIKFEADGSFEIAISKDAINHKNSLYAGDHGELICLLRELLPKDETTSYTLEEVDTPPSLLAPGHSKL